MHKQQPILEVIYRTVVELRRLPVEKAFQLFFDFIVAPEALATQMFL